MCKSSFRIINHNQIHVVYNCETGHYESMCSFNGNRLYIDNSDMFLFEYYCTK